MPTNKPLMQDDTEQRLRDWYPKGSTVWTILRHVSRSGMQREIGVVALERGRTKADGVDAWHPNYAVAALLDRRVNSAGDGIICHGAGMDMGFDLAYSLARRLYGDGYALNHRWL